MSEEAVQTPASRVLAEWLAAREGGAQRAGLMVSSEFQNSTTSVASSDPRVVEIFSGGNMSAAGVPVTVESSQRVATVYGCVSRIGGGISTMPLRMYERVWDQTSGRYQRKPVENADLWWLLNERPCAAFAAASFWEYVTQNVLLRGDGPARIARKKSGAIDTFVPMARDATEIVKRDTGRLMYINQEDGKRLTLDQDDVLHFTNFGFDGRVAPSVIQRAARQSVGNALAMDEYSGRFFASGAHASVVLESDKKMSDAGVQDLQDQFARKYSGLPNAHRLPMVLTEGLKAKTVSVSAEDAQLLDARRFTVADICRAFGVPPHMVGETSAATSWGSGIESMGRAFVIYTLQPHLVRFEQELNAKLFRTARYFVEFDRDALMAGDSKAQAEVDRLLMGGPGSGPGVMSQNEIRVRRNLPPIEGGDKVFYPDAGQSAAAAGKQRGDHETEQAPAAPSRQHPPA